jgi:hypothetical protein
VEYKIPARYGKTKEQRKKEKERKKKKEKTYHKYSVLLRFFHRFRPLRSKC